MHDSRRDAPFLQAQKVMRRGGTIAAVATPPGRGAVAIVRVSGPDAFAISSSLLGGRAPQPGKVSFSRFTGRSGEILDEGVVVAFKSPRSYTGEDVVEFQTHGGQVSPRRVLDALLESGARMARRGEFTERAFLNGKLDWSQAEGVIDLIDAKTVRAADDALAGISGRRTAVVKALYSKAVALSAETEHALDIDEGELPDSFFSGIEEKFAELSDGITAALGRERESRILRHGALVVLAGPPNAGKSSLMNALLDENRAIVSDEPGTTRDTLESWLEIEGFPVRLVDTAGMRETDSPVESQGVMRAADMCAKADIVLDLGVDPEVVPPEKMLKVHSKCDLGRGDGINVSSVTGEGLDSLKAEIARLLSSIEPAQDGGEAALDALSAAHSLASEGAGDDLVLFANRIRSIAACLGEACGEVYTEDMMDRLFSRFCVGK